MSLNAQVQQNLQNLFDENYKEIEHASLGQWLDLLEADNPDVFILNYQEMGKLYDDSILSRFRKASKDQEIIRSFDKAREMDLDEEAIINGFIADLESIFSTVRQETKSWPDSKMQILIVEYDYEPEGFLHGYGEGTYPVLTNPEYFDFNFRKDFFEAVPGLNYQKAWENLIDFEEKLEALDIYDQIFDAPFFQCLKNAYIYKSYLLLNKAFKLKKATLFQGLEIKKPLMVYGHEHDCEKINVFCFE